MTARATRNLLYRLHGWIGLNVSLLMFAIFLTGTLMVFVDEIASAVTPATRPAQPVAERSASFGQIYDSVRAAYPDVGIDWIARNDARWMGDQVHVGTAWGEPAWIWTHPETAAVLGTTPDIGLRRTIRDFHVSLMTQRLPGRLVVLSLALVLVGMIVTGLVTYRRFWRGFFRLPSGEAGTRIWWGSLHRLIALWSLPFLAAIVLSSLYFLLGNFGMTPKEPAPAAVTERAGRMPAGFDGAEVDALVIAAESALPGMEVHFMRFPNRPTRGVEINGSTHDAIFALDHVKVWADPATLNVVSVFRAASAPFGGGMTEVVEALHYGTWAGDVTRWVWLGFGLTGTLLSLSGALVFAARIVPGGTPVGPGLRGLSRIWRGMAILKWPLVAAIVAAAGIWLFKVAEIVPQWSRVYLGPPPQDARLMVKGAPQADRSLPLRIWVADGPAGPAVLNHDGTEYPIVFAAQGDGTVVAEIDVTATDGPNVIALSFGDGAAAFDWRLGRPLK